MAKKDALLIPLLSRILDVPEAALHDNRNLMHYGMDSMRTIRAATWLRREGIAVTFSDFIGKRTVKEWRQVISAVEAYRAVTDADAQPCDTPGFELATMQHAFWIGRNERQQLGGVSAHFYAEMDSKALDPERLASSLHRLIQRHDMLRLRIDEDARLHIAPDSPCQLQIHDFRELSAEQCHGRLAALRQRYTHQQLDIANGKTLMLALSLLPTGDSRLHIDLDMIAGDAASLRILLRELALGYRQLDYVLPPLRTSYRDYQQRWQKKHQHRREHDRAWWQTQLSRLATSLTLPLQSSEKTAPVTERRYLWLNPTQQQLTTMSHQSGLSIPVVLATIFGECIGLWSGGSSFLLNLPVFSRDEEIEDADRLVGDFSSSVLISVEPGSAASIIEQARQLQTQLHQALAHTAWSGVDVLRDLSRQQQSNASLALVVFTSSLALGDLFEPQVRAVLGEPVWSVSQGPQVLIDAQATEYLNGIMLNWDVRTDRFAPSVIDAMFDGFQQQVHALIDDITCWQRPLPVPPPVAPWPPEIIEPASAPTLLHRFFMQAEREPDAIALQWGEHCVLHYGELAQNALCIARFLQEQGIKTGDSVAISMGKGPEQVMAVLGTLAAGETYVPCGIDIPLARREAVYRLANVALVLCDSRRIYQPEWPQGIPVFPLVQGLQALPLAAPAEVDEQQAMYVIFTSGTTGEPKGVAVSHRAVANTVCGVDAHFTVTPSDCTITLSALDFDLSAYDIFSCLSRGARLAAVDEHQRRDAHEWLTLIQRYDVSIISCVPALLEMIPTAAGDTPLSSARLVMLGGDRIPVALAELWWRRTTGAPFVGLGGMTEAAIHSTLFVLHADDQRWTTVPFGTPLPNIYCRIVDALGALSARLRQVEKTQTVVSPEQVPLVTLWETASASTHPCVLLHAGSGDMQPYRCLLPVLNKSVYSRGIGIELPSPTAFMALPPSQALVRLAGQYVDALCELGESFTLIGYCFGGLLAAEMARQLSERGVGVQQLVVISAWQPPRVDDARLVEYVFARSHGGCMEALRLPSESTLAEVVHHVLRETPSHIPAGAFDRLPEAYQPVDDALSQWVMKPLSGRLRALQTSGDEQGAYLAPEGEVQAFAERHALFHHCMAAVGEHQPAPWTGKTVLIRNSASDPLFPGMPQDVTDYWQRLSLGDLTVVDTPSDHFSCITQQHAASLADCIARHAHPEEAL